MFFLWKKHVSCHFVFHYLRADFDRFRFKICFYESLFTIFELVHILLKRDFRLTWRNSDWMKIFTLRTTKKNYLYNLSKGSTQSKNCFVHQKLSTFLQKSTIESVHVCTDYSLWDRLRNFLQKFTWIVLSVHKLKKLGKFW